MGGLVGTLVLEDSYHVVTVDRQRDLLIEGTMAFATVLAARMQFEAKETVLRFNAAQAARQAGTGSRRFPLPEETARGPQLP